MLGSLEVGKIANLTILDTDLIHDDIEKLPYAQIVATIVDGHEVYNSADDPYAKDRKQKAEDFVREFLFAAKYD